MKKVAHIPLALMAVAILLLHGCKPDEETMPNVTEEDFKTIKDYTYFKPGTYWIYEDNYGNTDSMFVYEAGEGLDTANGYYYFTCRIHSMFDTYNYYISYNSGWTTFHPTRHQIFMDKTKGGDYVGQIILLELPFVQGNVLYGEKGGLVTSIDYYESFNNNSHLFSKVIKMNNSVDITNNEQNANYFIAKNAGIIQEELLDSNNVWKVVRYNIVQ